MFPCKRVAMMLVPLYLLLCVVADAQTLDLENGRYVTLRELVQDIKEAKVVFIGESHNNRHHHLAQMEIIAALHSAGVDFAIGIEMFRADSQDALDRWVKGKISQKKFRTIYDENWNRKWWDVYRPLFNYARNSQVLMVGLNLSREITNKVAREGIDSLSKKEMKELPAVQCILDDTYRDYIRRTLGRHDLQGTDFDKFCEAQLLWDKVMAKNISEYLAKHPGRKMVVLAGSGHAWKHGIPEQLKNNGEIGWRVILPEVPGQIQQGAVSFKDADYLLQGVEKGPIH